MLFLLVLACTTPEPVLDGPMTDPRTPPRPPERREVVLPAGRAISRECFASAEEEKKGLGMRGHGQGGGGATTGSAPPVAAPPPPAPMPAGSVSPADIGTFDGSKGTGTVPGYGAGASEGGAALPDPSAPSAPPATTASAPAGATPPVLPSAGVSTAAAEKSPAPSLEVLRDGPAPKASAKPSSEPSRADVLEEARRARLDWGGTTWLSNDDSMSLASAQRLLWAIQNREPVKTSEVRPHELLNYFSFDTVDVQPGQTFSVFGTAEPIGDGKLGLALAVKGVVPERRPLDLTLVLDRSGSMWDEGRMDYLKRGLKAMEGRLVRGDRVDVVLFDDELCTPLEDYVVGRDDSQLLDSVITRLEPRGSTDLDAGLREGYRIATARTDGAGRNRRMLLISDALLNEGEIDPDLVTEIGKGYSNAGVRLSAIGVGRTFNDKVLDMLSEKGQGAYVYLGSEAVVDRIFGPGFDSLTETVANDVHFGLDLPDSLAIEKFYGEESSTVKADIQPIDYYAGTTQLFLQDVAMRGQSPVGNDRVVLTVEWSDPVSGEAHSAQYPFSVAELLATDHHNLRKGRALMAWTDLVLARTLGNDPCASPYTTWDGRVRDVGPDAELAWLDGLTAPLCGERPIAESMVMKPGVPLKVRVDADQTIAEVGLRCGGDAQTVTLSGNVAIFSAAPGQCQLILQGTVPMTAQVDVPTTGGDVRCILRGGKLSCG